jgi:hypothetical protein
MPTRKPLKLSAAAMTKSAMPYVTAAAATNAFRLPVRSDSLPALSEATTRTADWTDVARKTCRGTSVSELPTCSSR